MSGPSPLTLNVLCSSVADPLACSVTSIAMVRCSALAVARSRRGGSSESIRAVRLTIRGTTPIFSLTVRSAVFRSTSRMRSTPGMQVQSASKSRRNFHSSCGGAFTVNFAARSGISPTSA